MRKAQAHGVYANITLFSPCCHLQLFNIYNLYYNKIMPYSNILLLHPQYVFKGTNVIMTYKVQRTRWHAKFHLTAYSKRQMYLSYWDKHLWVREGNVNYKWKEHQKLTQSQNYCMHIIHLKLSFPLFQVSGWLLLLWLIISQKTAVYRLSRTNSFSETLNILRSTKIKWGKFPFLKYLAKDVYREKKNLRGL
jgi:hypothetical protein